MEARSTSISLAEEKIVWWALVFTYPIYLLGTTYVVGSLLGWVIFATFVLRWFVEGQRENKSTPIVSYIWTIAMLGMLVVLWIGHADWHLGIPKTIKSSIGWMKGWALIPLFIWLGAVTEVKKAVLIRGACIVGYHSAIFGALTFIVYLTGFSGELFLSPFKAVGGPGDSFFTVALYGMNPETGGGRWAFFTPWAPAAGLFSCLLLLVCVQEDDPSWRLKGIIGCAVMCLLCQSRAGWAVFLFLIPFIMAKRFVQQPWFFIVLGVVIPMVLTLGLPLIELVLNTYEEVKASRPASTQVRQTLANIALQRWQAEAWFFGHGIVEPGPITVEGMPIGSHHTWYGLLFVKGFIGLLCLAIPLITTVIALAINSLTDKSAYLALGMIVVIIGYSFFENLEILANLIWPALFMIGAALNPRRREAV
ncbi:O-antigen ligase family protein [Alteromonas gracilis]|uniref:O-antigen ligase family protein n=1 Tax=Alteromonas gracilis TaxID=1479524 RepID=UPI003736ADC3